MIDWIGDGFDLDATDFARDQSSMRIGLRCVIEEVLEGGLLLEMLLKLSVVIASEPADDLIHLRLTISALLSLGDIEFVDASQG